MAMKVVFLLSCSFNLIEVVYFYCNKAAGKNLEVNLKTGKPRMGHGTVQLFSFCSVSLAVTAICLGWF